MRVKDVKLEWYVLWCDFNTDKIVKFNIFTRPFIDALHKEVLKKRITNLAQLKEYIRRWSLYYYWCKCEHEILVSGVFAKSMDDMEKIDVDFQIKMNLDRITEYVNAECKLNFK